jgi:hypothetical protein
MQDASTPDQGGIFMQGPRLNHREVIAVLKHEVEKLVELGAEQPAAIKMIARKHRVDPERVAWLLGTDPITGGEA